MNIKDFLAIVHCALYTGVPDSQLKPLCSYIMNEYGISDKHIIAANEGNAVGIAAGYYLATGKTPIVYLQNSGIGNIVNPVTSLLNDKVYGIPCIFIIGWRGEPGVHDEPQHIFQGEITLKLLEDLDVASFIINKQTTEADVKCQMEEVFSPILASGKSVAFIVKKDALDFDGKIEYKNTNSMLREKIIERIVSVAGKDTIVSTTGKASRELFEIREARQQGHEYDFLTVGSMGHSSSIALGIAINKPERRVWCIDGDGAVLMHMGAMAVIGANKPKNMIHIVINNSAHESVGGMPTVASAIDLKKIADGCGYPFCKTVNDYEELEATLEEVKNASTLAFIEAKAAIGARADLGRPTTSPAENKNAFMHNIQKDK